MKYLTNGLMTINTLPRVVKRERRKRRTKMTRKRKKTGRRNKTNSSWSIHLLILEKTPPASAIS
jgi:hypothetical protein